jgi:inosine-uridine nucleoside N-ribohydrolase
MICLGPLTNLAMALKLNPEIRMMLKEVYVVGGNMEAVGNMTPCSEFNFFVDPEAAQVVLDNISPCPLTILPLETCMNFATSLMEWRQNVLGNLKTTEMKFLNRVESRVLKEGHNSWAACAAALTACVIDPNVIKRTDDFHCTIELQGTATRGMMVVDRHFLQQRQSNATLITELDQNLYESMLVWTAGGPNYKSLNSFEMHYW